MLIDTGSAVTIVQEDAWKEAVGAPRRPLISVTYPIVVANWEQLDNCGESEVALWVGSIQTNHSLLVAHNITQECNAAWMWFFYRNLVALLICKVILSLQEDKRFYCYWMVLHKQSLVMYPVQLLQWYLVNIDYCCLYSIHAQKPLD